MKANLEGKPGCKEVRVHPQGGLLMTRGADLRRVAKIATGVCERFATDTAE